MASSQVRSPRKRCSRQMKDAPAAGGAVACDGMRTRTEIDLLPAFEEACWRPHAMMTLPPCLCACFCPCAVSAADSVYIDLCLCFYLSFSLFPSLFLSAAVYLSFCLSFSLFPLVVSLSPKRHPPLSFSPSLSLSYSLSHHSSDAVKRLQDFPGCSL